MTSTITFTEKNVDALYSLSELNTLFNDIAEVINAKLDKDSAELTDNLEINLNPKIINMADATEDDDAITVGQARSLFSA